ncbi:MAG: hypothetical protein NTW19_10985, partial [Planctomycetota bacterium]|nr:hypothetical protein [Planctomycetota bacterium]
MSDVDPKRDETQPANLANADLEREVAEALGDKSVEQIMAEAAEPAPAAETGEAADGSPAAPEPQRFEHALKR